MALAKRDFTGARDCFEHAVDVAGHNLSEANSAGQPEMMFISGSAARLPAGRRGLRPPHWQIAAGFKGDFRKCECAPSADDYYSPWPGKMGREGQGGKNFCASCWLTSGTPEGGGKDDYFATSLRRALVRRPTCIPAGNDGVVSAGAGATR